LSAEAVPVAATTKPGEHNPSCPCPQCAGKPTAAIYSVRQLSRTEIIEFISRPIHLGPAVPREEAADGKRRGPKKKLTVYDDALDRRRGLFHKLVRLPRHHINKHDDVAYDRDLVRQIVGALIERKQRITPATIAKAWPKKIPCPSEITIWRRLRELQEIAASSLKS
jgi:hypothetical protein